MVPDINCLGSLAKAGVGSSAISAPGVRFWLSAPAGAMTDAETLSVYFVVNFTTYEAAQSDPATGMAASDAVLRTILNFDAGAVAMRKTAFETCIGVHQFHLGIVMANVDALRMMGRGAVMPETGASETSEALWAHTEWQDTYRVTPLSRLVAYFWRTDSTTREELFQADKTVQIADPACSRSSIHAALVGTPEDVRVFHSVLQSTDASTAGLWMAQPTPSGTTVTRRDGTTDDETVAGMDFDYVCTSPLQVVTATHRPIDPDPVLLSGSTSSPEGNWNVYFGSAQLSTGTVADPVQVTTWPGYAVCIDASTTSAFTTPSPDSQTHSIHHLRSSHILTRQ